LLDLVEIDRGWEAAVEAALGEALAAVVVRDAHAARRALAHLDRAGVDGGVLAAADEAPLVDAPAVGERVRAHVQALVPAVHALLDRLLRHAVAVDGAWSDALDLALAYPTAVVVTRAGDRFSATGHRLGLGGPGATASALEEARREAAATGQRLSAATDG